MYYNFHPLIYKLLSLILFKLFILIGLVGILYLLRHICKEKAKDLYKYKLTYFKLNWVIIILYFVFFLGVMLLLRFKRLSSLDLMPLKLKLMDTYNSLGIIDSILLCIAYILIFLIALILIGKLRRFFSNQLIKRHLSLKYVVTSYTKPHINSMFKTSYGRLVFIFKHNYSYLTFTNYIHSSLAFGPLYYLLARINYWPEPTYRKVLIKLSKTTQMFLKLLPILMIPSLIFYDIYMHDWVITKIFYYLMIIY